MNQRGYVMPQKHTLTYKIRESIRQLISTGDFSADCFLPPERQLMDRFGVSRVTVRNALAGLVEENVLEVIPYKGYRPAGPVTFDIDAGLIAFVSEVGDGDPTEDMNFEQIFSAFSTVLIRKRRSLIAIGSETRTAEDVFREINEKRAAGVVLHSDRPDLISKVRQHGLPAVVVDAYARDPGMDFIIQNNFDGADAAARYLVDAGYEDIAWIGPTRRELHFRERFAGVRAALHDRGLELRKDRIVEISDQRAKDEAFCRVTALLKKKKRPAAIICLWLKMLQGAMEAVRKQGLEIGRDIALTGWCTERQYREVLLTESLGGMVPSAVIWSPEEMALEALKRLMQRRVHPADPGVRIHIRTGFRPPVMAEEFIEGT